MHLCLFGVSVVFVICVVCVFACCSQCCGWFHDFHVSDAYQNVDLDRNSIENKIVANLGMGHAVDYQVASI